MATIIEQSEQLYQALQAEWTRLIQAEKWTEAERLNSKIIEYSRWLNWLKGDNV